VCGNNNFYNIYEKIADQFKHNVKDDQIMRKNLQIPNLLVAELIVHDTQHGTALPPMSSSWENIVVCTRRDATFARSLNVDSRRHSHP
jgi:hypothetical protein